MLARLRLCFRRCVAFCTSLALVASARHRGKYLEQSSTGRPELQKQ